MNSRFLHLLLVGFVASLFLLNEAESFPDVCKGCWYEVPNTNLADVYKTPNPGPWSDQGGIMGAYSGAAYDLRRNRLIIAGGGGWGQYAGNEVYAFDVDSLKWTRILDGASVFDEADTVTPFYYNGGAVPDSQQPRPGFSFDAIEYDSTTDKVYLFGIIKSYSHGNTFSDINALDLNTLLWSHSGNVSTDNSFGGPVSAKDPLTGKIWFFANGYYPVLTSFYPPNNQYVDHGHPWMVSPGLPAFQSAAIMPSTQRLISVGGDAIRYWDISDTTVPMMDDSLPATNCDSLAHAKAPGFQWSPVHRKLIAWTGGNRVITMDSTYACEDIAPADSNTVTPDAPSNAGTYGRWQYIPKYDVFLLVNSTTGNVYFYRLSDSSGTPVVQITSPVDNYLTKQSSIAVAWTVNSVTQGTGTTETLTTEGANIVKRCYGGVCDSITVIRDQIAPVVVITAPAADTTTSTEPVTVLFTVDGQPRTRHVPMNPGLNAVIIDTLDAAGNRGADTIGITYSVPVGAPVWPSWSQLTVSDISPSSLRIAWTPAVDDSGVTQYRIYRDGIVQDSVPSTQTYYRDVGLFLDHAYTYKVEARDLQGNESTNGPESTFTTSDELPPDPETIAPPLDNTVASTIFAGASFLFNDTLPIQTGMAPDIIDTVRAAVLRGTVKDRQGDPIPGVSISVLGAKAFGSTVTRTDGEYDLMVNGGGFITLRMAKEGYLPVHRQLDIPWQRFVNYPEVVLIPLDSISQVITLDSAEPMQVFRASPVSDSDGNRQATLIIPTHTTGQKVYPDGSVAPLGSMTLRATEYTVGVNGPKAMPADLPPTSSYTYAVEYSADEILDEGIEVRFNQPIYSYLENFVGIPVGWQVPSAHYDRKKGHWIPEPDGRVIKVHSIVGGKANLVINSTGSPADSAELVGLGITTEERTELAGLYSVGQSLWRMPVKHFSPQDFNCASRDMLNGSKRFVKATYKNGITKKETDKGKNACGSVIGCHSQTLGESFPIVGTPFTMQYSSDRTNGRKTDYSQEIRLTFDSIPSGMELISLFLEIAGQSVDLNFVPTPNLTYTFEWNGRDVYGRRLQGKQELEYSIGYGFNARYLKPAELSASFGISVLNGWSTMSSRGVYTAHKRFSVELGGWKAPQLKLGGWSINAHHAYDVAGKILRLGDGSFKNSTDYMVRQIIETVAGTGEADFSGDNGPALEATLSTPTGINVGPDGSIYICDYANCRVRKVDPQGIITTVAGNGDWDYSGDGGPATTASLVPYKVNPASDGSLYITDIDFCVIRKVDSKGIISTIAGTGECGYSGDGGPAIAAQLSPNALAVSPDGSIYVAENSYRVRRIGPDGVIHTIAGTGSPTFSGDSIPSMEASFSPYGIDLDRDGNIYIADPVNARLYKISPEGLFTKEGGTGSMTAKGDGGQADTAGIQPWDVKVVEEEDGTEIYFVNRVWFADNNLIRKIGSDGIVRTVAGILGGNNSIKNGIPPTKQSLTDVRNIAVNKKGEILLSDDVRDVVRCIKPYLPGFENEAFLIPSPGGEEVYSFNSLGKHLKTLNGITGATLLSFEYDASGLLSRITDGNGNETRVERDGQGNISKVISPYDQETTFDLNDSGYIAKVTNPAGEERSFEYTSLGLLTEYTTPRGYAHEYIYDALGRLLRDEDPAGGYKELSNVETMNGVSSTLTTAMGRVSTYVMEKLNTGEARKTDSNSAGFVTETTFKTNGSVSTLNPDSSVVLTVMSPDPRFGMSSAYPESTVITLPSGKKSVITRKSHATFANNADPLTLQTFSDTVITNGRVSTNVYDSTAHSWVSTTPEGLSDTTIIDSLGRVIERHSPGLEPVIYDYDERGRLASITQGEGGAARITEFGYDLLGQLSSIENGEGHHYQFSYNLAGRPYQSTLPNGRIVGYAYDADGNVTSITPPGRSSHVFAFNPIGLDSLYAPPSLGGGNWNTLTGYNLDQQLLSVSRPDSQSVAYGYDSAGRLDSLISPSGIHAFHYNPMTGKMDSLLSPYGIVTAYGYDGFLTTSVAWSGAVTGSYSVEYDNDFRPQVERVNDSNSISYSYDNDGRPIEAGDMELSYSPLHGRLQTTSLGVVADSLVYNGFGEVSEYLARSGSDTLFHAHYTRDKLGRITEKTEILLGVARLFEFAYDSSGRLIQTVVDGVDSIRYAYDLNGNRRMKSHPISGIDSGTYDGQDRLLEYGGRGYTYNAHGDLTSHVYAGDTTQYAYDVFGNLLSVEFQDGTEIQYVVDAHNRRVGRKVNGILQQGFLYKDALEPVAELDDTGAVASRFVYASRSHVPDYMVRDGVRYRIISDHLGSPRLVINASTGALVQRTNYDEFGEVTYNSNPGFQPFGFAGGLYDGATGLVRFGARDYDASVGRWTAKDPIYFQGGSANLYVYVSNDPVNYFDPNGREFVGAGIGIVTGVVGGVIGGSLGGGIGGAIAGGIVGGVTGGIVGLIGGVGPFGAGISGAFGNAAGQLIGNYIGQPPNCAGPGGINLTSVGFSGLGAGLGYGMGVVAAPQLGTAGGAIFGGIAEGIMGEVFPTAVAPLQTESGVGCECNKKN